MPITNKRQKLDTKKQPKHLILNGFDMMCPSLQTAGLWKHPDDKSRDYNKIEYWTNLAKLLEKGKFNALFIADVLGGYDVYNGPRNLTASAKSGAQWPINDPHAVVSAMAAVTKSLSFAVTSSTISESPYHFARRLATNLLNGADLPDHDERYDKAAEFLEVVYQLFLSSWADDAVKVDPKSKIFSDPNLIREINYEGKYFKVPGPSIFEPTPQRLPVILQAGASSKGLEYAAKNAEAVFINGMTPEGLKYKIDKLKDLVAKHGRNPDDVKTVQLVTVIVGKTHDEAIAKYEDYKQYADKEGAQALVSGWSGINVADYEWDEELDKVESNAVRSFVEMWTKKVPGDSPNVKKTRATIVEQALIGGSGILIVGDPDEVADELIRWHEVSGVDGFNFTYAVSPGSFEDLVEYVIPVLQERGYAQKEYPKERLTFRENLYGVGQTFLKSDHPAYDLRWRAGETKEEFEQRFDKVWNENFRK
ncbi:dmoA Dimethyl-sulfide monooxygenase [Candida maltosa Xu316]